jgi:hypothetical protein
MNRAIPLSISSQTRSAVGRCAVLVILHDLPGDDIVYWPKQVALQPGTIRELSRNYLGTVRVPSENCQVTIREPSGNYQRSVKVPSKNRQGIISKLSGYYQRNVKELSENC